jgi:hypothetical protein
VEEGNEPQELNVYPNPSNGEVFIQERYAGQLKTAQIHVFDISGRQVLLQNGYQGPLQLQDLRKGMYLLRVETKTAQFTNRIVLQ